MCASEHTCVHTEARGQHWVPFSRALCLNFLIQLFCWPWSLPLNETGLRASWEITCLCYLPDPGPRFQIQTTMPNFSQGYWEFRRTSCLSIKYFINWAISPVPWCFFCLFFFSAKVLELCSPDLPQTHLELLDLPASISQSTCTGVCVTMQC